MEQAQYVATEFSRNLGLLSESEQLKLARSRVAVAGAGGVGGLHVLTLARLGVGSFSIADPDCFEPVNVNRQFGATGASMGRNKAEVLRNMVEDLNPGALVTCFPTGVTPDNLDAFLAGADLFVDGIDFFAIGIRRQIFAACRRLGVPALTAAPLGFGATLQIFAPNGMSFDQYFGLTDNMPHLEQIAAFAAGLAPRPYHLRYLDLSRVSLKDQTGPAVAPACTLAASLVATEAVRLLTGRGGSRPVPHYLQIDLLRGKYHRGWLPFGGRNPLQRLLRHLILRKALAAGAGRDA